MFGLVRKKKDPFFIFFIINLFAVYLFGVLHPFQHNWSYRDDGMMVMKGSV